RVAARPDRRRRRAIAGRYGFHRQTAFPSRRPPWKSDGGRSSWTAATKPRGRNDMSFSRIALAAASFAAVLATTAVRAEEIRDVEERHAMYLDSQGRMHMMTLNAAGHKMMMAHAHAVPAGAMIYRSGGRFYILENRKMGRGMMFDTM